MKNIFAFIMLLLCVDAYAATTFGGDTARIFAGTPYLAHVADSWASVLGSVGDGGGIAARMQTAHDGDIATFVDIVSILGYNDSALTLFEVSSHTDMAYSVLNSPLTATRSACPINVPGCNAARKTLVVDVAASGASTDYDSSHNADFKTHNTGVVVRAKGYVANNFAFGVEYTRTMTDTHGGRVYTDATGNSITLFSQYLADNGIFVNVGLSGGRTAWDTDKSNAGVYDDGVYDTNFYSGQVNGGIRFGAGRFEITPQIGARYVYMKTDRHIDGAAQTFDKWWYNTLTAIGGMRVGFDFMGPDFVVQPNVSAGVGYDVISHGDDDIDVHVISGQTYQVPVDAPARTAMNAGAGVGIYGASFAVLLDYKLDLRNDYTSHTGMINLKIAF